MKANLHWLRLRAVRRIIGQAVAATLLLWSLFTIYENTVLNLRARDIIISFDFLKEIAPFNVSYSPFWKFELGSSTYWDVFIIGIQNTILVSVASIFAATALGFLVGIMRVSSNWLVSHIAQVYIEIFRNIPLLLQIMFWYFVVFLDVLPPPRESFALGTGFYLNNSGLFMPLPTLNETANIGAFFLILGVAALLAASLYIRALRLEKQGFPHQGRKMLTIVLAFITTVAAAYYLSGGPVLFEFPELGVFTFSGGIEIPLSLFTLWFALSVYTAAFIAENVRGGILAVSKGQKEASHSLGMTHLLSLRLIIVPQAMRVIIPPTISQYINIVKNSSLAVAISYEELVNLWAGIALNQTGQALIIVAMTIAVYETLNLLTSAFLNWYNKRAQILE